jgi:hypothetical protein
MRNSKQSRERLDKPKSLSIFEANYDSNPNVRQLRKVISLKKSKMPLTGYSKSRKDASAMSSKSSSRSSMNYLTGKHSQGNLRLTTSTFKNYFN